MRIRQNITNKDLEKLYDSFDGGTLNLSSTFKTLRLGLLARLCQYLITTLKQHPHIEVKFFQLDSSKHDSIRNMLKDPQSLTALLLAENVYAKDFKNDLTVNPVELKSKINVDIQERLNTSIFLDNHRLQLFAVDHSIARYAYPLCFYKPAGTPNLRQSGYYSTLLSNFLNEKVKLSTLVDQEIDSLGELLFELVENTEQHGTADFRNGKFSRSVRGLVIDYKLITKDQSSENIGGVGSIITEYLSEIREDQKPLHVLEISLFDSGVGIAKTLNNLSDNLSIDPRDEALIVASSFAKGVTSKTNGKGFGRGLHNVRQILGQRKGFLSIRSGRVSLYRDFNLQPFVESENDKLELFDERTRSSNQFQALHSVEGLACSILVPVL